ncbi:TetR/AcrR family transcriptional regulator [Spirosoma oryzicola]|uniref:TetR/AcrR family transcriptional regulator n=1 Tax=Spirosoma oryzicola TaxID=2898794 RepID=UPI001E4EB838|nr:TetR/AcrR family transcriptional regulator [Spirosoma oryzicola]UHG94714.1 TetR/AcrR family transcriptional regulator [Spirosoma oryzicola]
MKKGVVQQELLTTEDKIKNAAREVFLEKGFEKATTREIAERLGMNRALMNYYFRTKEKLFDAIFEELLQQFLASMHAVLTNEQNLRDKIKALIDYEFTAFSEQPQLVALIVGEINRNPVRYQESVRRAIVQPMVLFDQQLQECIRQQKIRPINAEQLLDIIGSITSAYFINKPVRMHVWQMTESDFSASAQALKQAAIDIILNGLFLE